MLALLDVGYSGPLILECSSLPGPSRLKREVDLARLETDLRISHEWLRGFRAGNETWSTMPRALNIPSADRIFAGLVNSGNGRERCLMAQPPPGRAPGH